MLLSERNFLLNNDIKETIRIQKQILLTEGIGLKISIGEKYDYHILYKKWHSTRFIYIDFIKQFIMQIRIL